MLISVLHGKGRQSSQQELDEAAKGGFASLVPREEPSATAPVVVDAQDAERQDSNESQVDWASNMRLLLVCFLLSGMFTVTTYFFPILRNLPIFGTVAAQTWLWTFNPSFAYVGQGIIMGAETTMHMLLGAIVGWGVLSPLAKNKGWAPGPVSDWETGSKGWIVWVSLAIMLIDAVVSLTYVALQPLVGAHVSKGLSNIRAVVLRSKLGRRVLGSSDGYTLVPANEQGSEPRLSLDDDDIDNKDEDEDADAPKHQRVGKKTVVIGLTLSILLCIGTIHIVFGDLVPLYATAIAVFMALVLSIMGVRALGETDLNPVSGISKLAQLFFAFIIPQSNKNSVLINLVAGAVVSFPTSKPTKTNLTGL